MTIGASPTGLSPTGLSPTGPSPSGSSPSDVSSSGLSPGGAIPRRGLCLVVAAPSGTGKSTITRRLLAEDAALSLSISMTTRAPRPGERDGEHYFFRSQAAFDTMAATGGLLEHATVFGRSYGTPREPVLAALKAGRDVLFDIDWQGHRQLHDRLPGDVVGVFVLPPTLHALEQRLRSRAADDAAEIARRMQAARAEIAQWQDFDHVVLNDDLDQALGDVSAILRAARLERARQTGLADFIKALIK